VIWLGPNPLSSEYGSMAWTRPNGGALPEERELALTARDFLAAASRRAGEAHERGLRQIWRPRARRCGGCDRRIAQALLAAGLARAYHGERRETWCAPK